MTEVRKLTTFYLAKNDHRWVTFIFLKTSPDGQRTGGRSVQRILRGAPHSEEHTLKCIIILTRVHNNSYIFVAFFDLILPLENAF